MVSFPYYSHTTPIRIPKDMGMVWEASHKGGPIVGGPWKIPLQKAVKPITLKKPINSQGLDVTHPTQGKA